MGGQRANIVMVKLTANKFSNSRSQQLHEDLLQLILDTEPGDRLPSEPSLAKQLGVSRATLREAMRTFETQGMIHRRQGVGTFVIHPTNVIESGLEVLQSIETLAESIDLSVKMGAYEVKRRLADQMELDALGLEAGAGVVSVTRVIEAEQRPVAYLIDVLPNDILSQFELTTEFTGSVLDLLLQRGDPPLETSNTEISAIAATPDIARALGIQRGDVVQNFIATLYTDKGIAIDYSESYFLPGYFRFHIVRRVNGKIIKRR